MLRCTLNHPVRELLGPPFQAFECDACGFIMTREMVESQGPRWRPTVHDPYFEPRCEGCRLEGSLFPFNYYRATRKS